MNQLYPLKFKPLLKEKIWGGSRIKKYFNLDYSPLHNCGEAWLVSGVEDNPSVVSNGFLAENELNELVEVYMTDLVGEKVYYIYKNRFPVLIKLIDANEWLSVQVHPDDKLAKKRQGESGKTEMWYINKAEENAEIICGFNREMDKEKYNQYLQKGRLRDILNYVKVKDDDVIFIPSGRIHATGPGILLTEIQQTSDITYRIYDWDRLDAQGNSRELHTDDSLEALDFKLNYDFKTPFARQINKTVPLAACPYFTTNLLQIDSRFDRDYNIIDSFVIYIGQKGNASIEYEGGRETISAGEAVLIPASITNLSLIPEAEAELLEVYIE
jgi:mannose-6-phosphate isomerase